MKQLQAILGVSLVLVMVFSIVAGMTNMPFPTQHRTHYATLQGSTGQHHALRSDSDPDVVGNIFEFSADAGDVPEAQPSTHTPKPGVIMEVMDPSLEPLAGLWQKEIARRFDRAVGVLCHGGNFVDGQWIVSSKAYEHLQTAQELVKHFQAAYPDRVIVLLACNPGHLKLGIPGVYYAHSSVWVIPDRQVDPSMSEELQTAKLGF